MFHILLIVILSLFIFGYMLVTLWPVMDELSAISQDETSRASPVKVRGEAQDETNPREAIYARIRQRLKKPEE